MGPRSFERGRSNSQNYGVTLANGFNGAAFLRTRKGGY